MRSLFPGAVALGLLIASVAGAATPPAVGERAPEFALATVEGKRVALADYTAQGPVVLVVLRGYPGYQCPLCTRQVNEFVGRAREFATKGARVVLVYPGSAAELRERAREFRGDKAWPGEFELLVDPNYAFTQAYGLRWDAPRETAYPATFVIGRDGKVRWAKVSRTHGGRASAAEVLAKL